VRVRARPRLMTVAPPGLQKVHDSQLTASRVRAEEDGPRQGIGGPYPPEITSNGTQVLAAAHPALNRGGEGSSPSGPTRIEVVRMDALVVQRQDSALVTRRRGFDSHPVLSLTIRNKLTCAHEVVVAYRFAKAEVRVQIPLSTLGDRLMVGPRVLIPAMEVQVLLPDSIRGPWGRSFETARYANRQSGGA
jgi:hypothetical protein